MYSFARKTSSSRQEGIVAKLIDETWIIKFNSIIDQNSTSGADELNDGTVRC